MDSTWFTQLLQHDSNLLVFGNVFLQQLGLLVPSVPTMVLAGSQSSGLMALATMLLAAVLTSLLADWIWYAAGRKFGYRVLSLLCKVSINPSTCVNQTEARFTMWGVWSLVFGKRPGSSAWPPCATSTWTRSSKRSPARARPTSSTCAAGLPQCLSVAWRL